MLSLAVLFACAIFCPQDPPLDSGINILAGSANQTVIFVQLLQMTLNTAPISSISKTYGWQNLQRNYIINAQSRLGLCITMIQFLADFPINMAPKGLKIGMIPSNSPLTYQDDGPSSLLVVLQSDFAYQQGAFGRRRSKYRRRGGVLCSLRDRLCCLFSTRCAGPGVARNGDSHSMSDVFNVDGIS